MRLLLPASRHPFPGRHRLSPALLPTSPRPLCALSLPGRSMICWFHCIH